MEFIYPNGHTNDEGNPNVFLVIIDPQNDFYGESNLGIPGAIEDSIRLSDFIKRNINKISQIYVTLDSHYKIHVSFPIFWTNAEGASPAPFTVITNEDVLNRNWIPRDISLYQYAVDYTRALEAKGKFHLLIWPEHCLIGTTGHAVYPTINEAIQEWSEHTRRTIRYIHKGMNPLTEMYSAMCAEVPLKSDIATNMNTSWMEELRDCDMLLVGGEAASHCVNFTVRDITKEWDKNKYNNIYIFKDASSSVPGFEESARTFLSDMNEIGVNIINCEAFDL